MFSKGFFLPADSDKHRATLKKEDFQKLFEANSDGVYKTLFKLTEKHINLVGSQKQNVRLATQLFSRTISISFVQLAHLFPSQADAIAKANAVELFNDWYVYIYVKVFRYIIVRGLKTA